MDPRLEQLRLDMLARSDVMGYPSEEFGRRIVWLAMQHFGTPIAAVSFVGAEHLWIKTAVGVREGRYPRDHSFSSRTIESSDVLQVTDPANDPYYAKCAFVCEPPHVAFYAGAPMVTRDGIALGSLGIMDTKPRPLLNEDQQRYLKELAKILALEVELRLTLCNWDEERATREARENELRQVGDRFRQALQGSPVCLITQDMDLRYTWAANTPAPITPAHMIGRTDREIFNTELAEIMESTKAKVLSENKVQHCVMSMDLEQGTRLYHTSFEPMLDEQGRPAGIAGICIDITETHATRLALEEAVRSAQAANNAKTRYLASVSHDLRQPTQSLLLFLEIARNTIQDPLALKALDQAQTAALGLKGMLDEFMDISRLDAGLITPKMAQTELHPILQKLFETFAPRFERKGLKFVYVPTSVRITTDGELLRRMIRNLLENALRYTKSGGAVLGVRKNKKGDCIIEVTDSGPGMPDAKLDDIFLEFVQLHNPERDRTKGLGLGLSMVKRLAALMGHRVVAQSREGTGSRFRIFISTTSPISEPADD